MREIRFEVRTRTAPYFMAPIGRVEGISETVHVPSDVLLQLWRLTGPPEDVDRFADVLAREGRDPHRGNVVLHQTGRSIHFVAKWDPPCPTADPTLENLFATLAWSEVLLRIRARQGEVHVRALDEDRETLLDLYRKIEARFGERWQVRLVRSGEVDRSDPARDPVMAAEDLELLDLALERGYYDVPKGCGVRELGEELGISKSAVNRKLRSFERRALEDLRDRAERWPTGGTRADADMSPQG